MKLTSTTRWVTTLSFAVFVLLAVYADHGGIWWPETYFLSYLHSGQSLEGKTYAHLISDLGRGRSLLPLALCPVLVLMARKDWRSVLFVISCLGVSLINPLLKLVLHRGRPVLLNGHVADWNYGFPSGHATLSSAVVCAMLYVALVYYRQGKMKVWVFGAAAAMGLSFVVAVAWSRMYLQAHYPSDIIGGWASSLAWVGCMRLKLWKDAAIPGSRADILEGPSNHQKSTTETFAHKVTA